MFCKKEQHQIMAIITGRSIRVAANGDRNSAPSELKSATNAAAARQRFVDGFEGEHTIGGIQFTAVPCSNTRSKTR